MFSSFLLSHLAWGELSLLEAPINHLLCRKKSTLERWALDGEGKFIFHSLLQFSFRNLALLILFNGKSSEIYPLLATPTLTESFMFPPAFVFFLYSRSFPFLLLFSLIVNPTNLIIYSIPLFFLLVTKLAKCLPPGHTRILQLWLKIFLFDTDKVSWTYDTMGSNCFPIALWFFNSNLWAFWFLGFSHRASIYV